MRRWFAGACRRLLLALRRDRAEPAQTAPALPARAVPAVNRSPADPGRTVWLPRREQMGPVSGWPHELTDPDLLPTGSPTDRPPL